MKTIVWWCREKKNVMFSTQCPELTTCSLNLHSYHLMSSNVKKNSGFREGKESQIEIQSSFHYSPSY
jgi:hypothetical protein